MRLLPLLLVACSSLPQSSPMYMAPPLEARSDPPPPRAEEAIATVWHTCYQRDDAPPAVRWVSGERLNCANGTGYQVGHACMGGRTESPRGVTVAAPAGRPLHESGLAHEFLHALLWRDGASDVGSGHPEWFRDEYGACNQLLIERGM